MTTQSEFKALPFILSSGIAQRFKDYIKTLQADALDHDAKIQIRQLIQKAELKPNNDIDLFIDFSGLIDKKIPATKGEYHLLVAGAGPIWKIQNILALCA